MPSRGLAGLQGQGEERLLHGVPLGHGNTAQPILLTPVELGVYVLAPGEQEAVEQGGVALQGLPVGSQGQQHRHGAGVFQSLGVPGEHPVALQFFIVQAHNGDGGLHLPLSSPPGRAGAPLQHSTKAARAQGRRRFSLYFLPGFPYNKTKTFPVRM